MPQIIPLLTSVAGFDALGLGQLGQAVRVVDLSQPAAEAPAGNAAARAAAPAAAPVALAGANPCLLGMTEAGRANAPRREGLAPLPGGPGVGVMPEAGVRPTRQPA